MCKAYIISKYRRDKRKLNREKREENDRRRNAEQEIGEVK